MTTKPLKKGATYDDLVRVPEHYVAEMGNVRVRARPFDAVELELRALWG